MSPFVHNSDDYDHQAVLNNLDLYKIPKLFKNPYWKPAPRRNKTLRQVVADVAKQEAAAAAAAAAAVAAATEPTTDFQATPVTPAKEKTGSKSNTKNNIYTADVGMNSATKKPAAPVVTYQNIESAPSFHPSSQRRYCDITGLPALYTDPKTRLRYHNVEVFAYIQGIGQGVAENYLEARGAHTVLK